MEHQKRNNDGQDAVTEGLGAPRVRMRNFAVPAPCHERLLLSSFRFGGHHQCGGQAARTTSYPADGLR
jgi:hypothetical protein